MFNRVPEKVGGALVQSQVRLNRVPEKVPEKLWCKGQVQQKVPEKVWRLWCKGQVQQGFRRRFRIRSGRLWCSQVRFNRVLEKFPVKAWEALVQSRVRFNRVPEKVPDKFCEALALVQSQGG